MIIKPEGKKILVLPLEAKEAVVGSIIIPAGVNMANLSRAKVVAVSDYMGKKYNIGDIVLHPTGSGYGQIYNKEFHLWLTEREYDSDIWGVENPKKG
jgi:co-chaperonin GroES (HSP10)